MGNICRSPTAEGVFRALIAEQGLHERFTVDSAGTHAYHVGDPPDARAIEAAHRRGIDLSGIRARKVTRGDFADFDLILAMDEDNHGILTRLGPDSAQDRIRLFLEFAPHTGRRSVPDPYYGAGNGFEEVLDLVEDASRGLLEHLLKAR